MHVPLEPMDPRRQFAGETRLVLSRDLEIEGAGVPARVLLLGLAHRFPWWGYARDDTDWEHLCPDRFWGYVAPPKSATPLRSPLPASLRNGGAAGLSIFEVPLDRYRQPPSSWGCEVLTEKDTYFLFRPTTKRNFEDVVLATLRMHSHRLGRRVDWRPLLSRIEGAVCGQRLRMWSDPFTKALLLRTDEPTGWLGMLLGALDVFGWLRAERLTVRDAPLLHRSRS